MQLPPPLKLFLPPWPLPFFKRERVTYPLTLKHILHLNSTCRVAACLPLSPLFSSPPPHTHQENAFNYDKGVLAEILEPIMGKGLIPADLDTWRVRRRAIVPAFHKAYYEVCGCGWLGCVRGGGGKGDEALCVCGGGGGGEG